MHEIERFTRQQIPVRILDGYGPAPGEQAEPIAMGRQTLWGGLGKPPSREVMQTAARAARQEMMRRIRENKTVQGSRGGRDQQPLRVENAEGARNGNPVPNADGMPIESVPQAERLQGGGLRTPRNNRRRRGRGGNDQGMPQSPRQIGQGQPPQPRATREFGFDDEDDDRDLDHLPRHIDPLQTNLHGRRNTPRGPSHGAVGQPDPMRTSIDLMGKNKGSGGGGRGNKRGRGGSGGRGSGR
jgi:ATP-dependent RNA helicase RhlE